MFKAWKTIFPNCPLVERVKDIKVTSLPQRLPSLLKHRFPSRNQYRQHQTSYFLNYPTIGTKDCIYIQLLISNPVENSGHRQVNLCTNDYSKLHIATAIPISENRLQKQCSALNCFSSSVKKENVFTYCDQKEVLSNDLHCLRVATGSANSNPNNLAMHRIPTGPSPTPPREPTYPPTCPPSLAPPYPVQPPCPYNKPRPVNFPEHSRQRSDVPMCPPCTVYPIPPPSVTPPRCPPLVNPLKDVHLPKRKP